VWSRRALGLVLACACALALASAGRAAAARDDTAWLQARLDAGGTIELPALPGGACYRTRGLWISRDDTTIESPDGACVVGTGPGETRLRDGSTPGPATAVFFISNSSVFAPPPVRVTIRDVRLVVPASARLAGIAVLGHEVTLDHLSVGGSPTVDVGVGSATGNAAERVSILDSTLTGGSLDVLAAYGVIGLDVERNTLAGAQRGSGLHLHPSNRGQPILHVTASGNTIARNAGPGVLLGLHTPRGLPVVATGIWISGNTITANSGSAILVQGGQRDGHGTLSLANNLLQGNRHGIVRLPVVPTKARAPKGTWQPPARVLASAGADDTRWLQRRLDAGGGSIFLPALPDGRCYATHGLWVWHDDTRITSNGACMVALGPGPVRLSSTDGDPIPSNAVFFVNRNPIGGGRFSPAPANVTISGLSITVPPHSGMYGILVGGHDVTIERVSISGSPIDDVMIGARATGGEFVAGVSVLDSTLAGAQRNGISIVGAIGLRVVGNTISGVQDVPGQPGAGIDIEPDQRSQPTLDVAIEANTIRDNSGPGVLVSLDGNTGSSVIASGISISGNSILRDATRPLSFTRAGIAIVGGQDGGAGTLALTDNLLAQNGGRPILIQAPKLVVTQNGNIVD
jgi:hypothetical protein